MRPEIAGDSNLVVFALFLATTSVLVACAGTGLKPETLSSIVAKPQVIYRIDDHRYFMIENRGERECYEGTIVYIDEKLQIKSDVESWERARRWPRKFTIDASNEKYLGAPTAGSSGNCSSGSGNCFGSATVYSIDYGRTWVKRRHGGDANIVIVGNKFYEYELSILNSNSLGREKGAYFDMTKPDSTAPYYWIKYREPGTPWTLADYGMKKIPEQPSTGQKQALDNLDIFQKSDPSKIKSAPLPTRKPIENAFHCVITPIINND